MADLRNKRRQIALEAMQAATQLVDSLNALIALKEERAVAGNFLDTDFNTPADNALIHLDAGTIGTLFDFVVPNLQTNYIDAANGNRNRNILLQVRS